MADDPTVPRPTKKPLLPRWLKFLLMLVGFLFLVSALLWVIADISTRDALDAELRRLGARGMPLTYADLGFPEVSDEENAALVYEEAFAQLQPLDDRSWEIRRKFEDPLTYGALEDEELRYLEDHVAKNQTALELLHQAAQMARCQFVGLQPPEISGGRTGPTEEVRQMTIFVVGAAIPLAAEEGQGARPFGYWLDLVALLRGLEDHQSGVADQVRILCLELSLSSFESLLARDLLDEAQLAQAITILDGLEARGSMAASQRAGIASSRSLFDSPAESLAVAARITRVFGQTPSVPEWALEVRDWLYATWLFRPARQHDEEIMLSFQAEVASLIEQPYFKVRSQVARLRRKANEIPAYALLSRPLFLEASANTIAVQARHEAEVRCARAALALELSRKRTGEYPQTLDALIPDILAAIPVDPFDGQPLRYINDGKRVVVYSVGKDLQGDGGSEEPRPLGLSTYGPPKDIVFTLRRVGRE